MPRRGRPTKRRRGADESGSKETEAQGCNGQPDLNAVSGSGSGSGSSLVTGTLESEEAEREPKSRRVGSPQLDQAAPDEPECNEESVPQIPSDSMQKAMQIELILREVLKNLPTADLVVFSEIDHLWNRCARSVLRKQRRCSAFILREHACWHFKELDTLLGNSRLLNLTAPFNGISLTSLIPDESSDSDSEEEFLPGVNSSDSAAHKHVKCRVPLSSFYANLLDETQLSCKYISIDSWTNNEDCEKCPGHIIFKKIILNSASTLEGLTIDSFRNEYSIPSLQSYLKCPPFSWSAEPCLFPQLKWLSVPPRTEESDLEERELRSPLLMELIRAAPNVTLLTGGLSTGALTLLVDADKTGVIQELDLVIEEDERPEVVTEEEQRLNLNAFLQDEDAEDENYNRPFEEKMALWAHFAKHPPKLHTLAISTFHSGGFFTSDEPKWISFLSQVYTATLNSSSSLRVLTIHHFDLILLSRLDDLRPLQCLNTLRILYCPRLARTLSCINYSRLFPAVQSVSFECELMVGVRVGRRCADEEFYVTADLYEGRAIQRQEYIWPSVRALEWDGDRRFWDRQMFPFDNKISRLFPNVTKATFSNYDNLGSACTLMWTAWPLLEEIAFLHLNAAKALYVCLDAHFAGMTKKHCDVVWNAIQDGEDCTALIQQFQTRPSMRNLTKLKTFRVEFRHSSFECRYGKKKNLDEVFLSEVTKQSVLNFMPQLYFEIRRNTCHSVHMPCCFAMDHLRPNVKFISI